MHLTIPSFNAHPIRNNLHWYQLVILSAFVLTLLFTIQITDAVITIFFPDAFTDPTVVNAVIKDLLAEPSAPPEADLASLGFKADDNQDDEDKSLVILGNAQPTTSPTTIPLTLTSTPPTPLPTVTSSPTAALPTWDKKGRVNILLMGLDGTSSAGRFRRADTLIVVSYDPVSNSAVMLSIPRDLFVTIPGLKTPMRNRINTAYVWGEYYKYPGGGPALQMRTVQETLGIPIHHYVAIHFDGFAKVIDAIGGIDIYVEQSLRDSFTGWSFNKGMQHMDGATALKYARSRYSTSDFSRARRQQQVLLAARDKVLKANILPRLPQLLPSLASAFRTDLSMTDLLALASAAAKLDRNNIVATLIDETMVTGYTTSDGARVLLPKMDRIRAHINKIFSAKPAATPVPLATPSATPENTGATTPSPQQQATATSTEIYRSEHAKIEILNGTYTVGLARRTSDYLTGLGLQVARIADAKGVYKQTILYHDGSAPATKDYLVKLLNIRPENVHSFKVSGLNIRLVLGSDLKLP